MDSAVHLEGSFLPLVVDVVTFALNHTNTCLIRLVLVRVQG